MSSLNNDRKGDRANITFNKIKKKRRGSFVIFAIICLFMASLGGAFTAVLMSDNITEVQYFDNELKKGESLSSKNNNRRLQDITGKTVRSVVSIINVITGEYYIKEVNTGVGVVLDESGYIITSYDNIADASKIKIKSYNDMVYDAKLVGFDNVYDIAMLHVENGNLEPIQMVDGPVDIKDGDEVISIGNPIGKSYSASVEIGTIINSKESVMFRNSQSKVSELLRMIKTTIPPKYINTGAALCNTNGELIGINNTAMTYHNDYLENSFYINIEDLGQIVENILDSQDSMINYMGIYGEVAVSQQKDGIEGVYAKEVIKNGLAYEAGIRPTDIITEVNEVSIDSVSEINEALSELNEGEEINLRVYRSGEYKDFVMKVPIVGK